jgi:hypothetical protein
LVVAVIAHALVRLIRLTCPSQKFHPGADHVDLVPSRGRGRADSMAGP